MQKNLIFIVVLLLLVAGGAYVVLSGNLQLGQQEVNQNQEQEELPAVRTLSGKVLEVNENDGWFRLNQEREKREFTVFIGENTSIVKLQFPFDAPQTGEPIVPERVFVELSDLKEGDDVFVRSSQDVRTGDEITNPVEIQILP